MSDKKLSTESYKGVRDFYPEDAVIQQYIFETWSKTAESFGFERYDASILEPSDLYKAKGAENEEMVNEQTYTFTDRGEREVTLRPEMTPTVARMVAGKARELAFPLRWYSIPNLFRYERPQKGRLREHWQLNCDIFGSDSIAADIEVIALANQTLIDFGVKPEQFKIKINDRSVMKKKYADLGISEDNTVAAVTRLNDRKDKISTDEYFTELTELVGEKAEEVKAIVENRTGENDPVLLGLIDLDITNVIVDRSLARGFDYYTGTIFEIFEVDENGNSTGRSMLGGGRYDNLTGMFGGEPISGIGFGMGDVTMRDFLESNNLIPDSVKSTAATVTIIPETTEQNLYAQKVATKLRLSKTSVSVDIGTQKVDKKKSRASERGTKFIIIIGENEVINEIFTVKNLLSSEEKSGSIESISNWL